MKHKILFGVLSVTYGSFLTSNLETNSITKNRNSLICQTGFGRVAQTVQQVDQDTFNRLYN